jgi:16S rRNA (cytosine1402-N4)-methyltransferase
MTSDPTLGADGGQAPVHRPVLRAAVLASLDLRSGQIVVDATVGAGGHASEVLAAITPGGTLIGIDRDAAVLEHARRTLEAAAARAGGGVGFRLFQASFSRMSEVLQQEGLDRCDRVLLDLGVSSLQLDTAARGFSFSHDGPLDMRMDQDDADRMTAAQWLGRASEREIARVLWDLGEERHARRIARAIVARRARAPLQRTGELADLVRHCLPAARGARIHPATRTFQAIRMHVNDELGELERGLAAAEAVLRPGGRLVVITFHSGEDRVVKHFLRSRFAVPERKPVVATAAEVAANPRARSAKLRYGIRPEEQHAPP